MSDDPVKECEVCGEPVRRLLFPVAIQFKGKGFYSTDYAKRSTLGAGSSCSSSGERSRFVFRPGQQLGGLGLRLI